jgi:hypothetical protein
LVSHPKEKINKLRVFEKRVLRRISDLKGGPEKSDHMKENEMGRAITIHDRHAKCIYNLGRKT